jgi:negative regulator of flagellin synthesis FlgM
MEIQGSDRVQGPRRIERKAPISAQQAQKAETPASADQVQISPKAQHLSSLSQAPEVRMDRILQIREEIANGTYETPEKYDKAVERLLKDLGG